MASEIKKGLYQHYKGKLYEVVGVGRHSETLEEVIVYRGLYEDEEFGKNPIWVRPINMFLEEIEIDGKKIPRFKYLGEKEIK